MSPLDFSFHFTALHQNPTCVHCRNVFSAFHPSLQWWFINLQGGNHLFRGPVQLYWNSKSQTSHTWQNCLIWFQRSIKGPIFLYSNSRSSGAALKYRSWKSSINIAPEHISCRTIFQKCLFGAGDFAVFCCCRESETKKQPFFTWF